MPTGRPTPSRLRASGEARVQGAGPVADALRELAHGASGPEILVDGLGGTVARRALLRAPSPARGETQDHGAGITGTGRSTASHSHAGRGHRRGRRAGVRSLGLHTARVRPSAVGVLPRIVCQVINECAFALGEGVGSAAGHRRRDDTRHELPPRPARVGARDRRGSRDWRRSMRCGGNTARSATAWRPCYADRRC